MLTKIQLDQAKVLNEYINKSMLSFTYDPKLDSIIEQLGEIQAICEHSYVDGICKYCGKEL